MKFLVVFACALAVAAATYIAPVEHVYAGAQHVPVIGQDGVPVDTAEVQHAKAAHYAHKAEAHARNGDYYAPYAYAHDEHHAAYPYAAYPYSSYYSGYYNPYSYAAGHYGYAGHYGHQAYPTTAVHPTSFHGVPQETPEVVAAKAKHFEAHAEALARNSPVHYRKRRGVFGYGAYPAYSSYSYGAYPYSFGRYGYYY